MMPEMDGFAFLEALRQQDAWRSIPVVVVTAKDLTPEDRQRLNGYVEQILRKGAYSREALLHEIHRLVTACIRSGRSGTEEVRD
jgi:CheY-like chemotaxis protein